MKWILDNIQVIITVAGAVAAWWIKRRKEAEERGAGAPLREGKTFADPELAERTRRIREEIQRKIEQRAKGYAAQQPKTSQPEPAPMVRQVVITPDPSPARMATSRQEIQRAAEVLEEQAALMEKLQEAKALRTAAEKRTVFEEATADHAAEALSQTRSTILDDLRTPDALRRAFILREVLGPPVALR